MTGVTVRRLRVAPVKALACVDRQAVHLSLDGVPEDRRLFMVDASGAVVTQRQHPRLAGVVPELDLASGTLALRTGPDAVVVAALEPLGEPVATTLFGKSRFGHVVARAAGAVLSDMVGEPLRLVLAAPGTGWDEGPVSLLSSASAQAVLPSGGSGPDTLRFRMNVEMDGLEPFAEDGWVGRTLRLGQAVVRVTQPLGRCVLVNHSPVTGEKDWDGLRELARIRGRDAVDLGVIASVVTPGDVRIGDEVEVQGAQVEASRQGEGLR
jgi:hypothetical protein